MDRKRLYPGFTLVEMLIVMGILIILMAVGITAGRFAINRANDVAHQNAVDKIYTAAQAYYTDNREFPTITDLEASMSESCEDASNDCIQEYLDINEFTGGTEATYYYMVDATDQQEVLVCVSLGGAGDEKLRGFYCNGNGFGSLSASVTSKEVPANATADGVPGGSGTWLQAEWDGKAF